MTEDEFAEIVRTASSWWGGRAWPEETIDVWWSQMQHWKAEYVLSAIPKLARESEWLPPFSVLAEAYRIERTTASPRHLHAVSERYEAPRDLELAARWGRVIELQLRQSPIGSRVDTPLGRAVRRHYRREHSGLVVMDGARMLADAEAELAGSFVDAAPIPRNDAGSSDFERDEGD